MMLPLGPLVDANGNVTLGWREFFQRLAAGMGGPAWEIEAVRVDDTHIKWRMKGSDGVVRNSGNTTLS